MDTAEPQTLSWYSLARTPGLTLVRLPPARAFSSIFILLTTHWSSLVMVLRCCTRTAVSYPSVVLLLRRLSPSSFMMSSNRGCRRPSDKRWNCLGIAIRAESGTLRAGCDSPNYWRHGLGWFRLQSFRCWSMLGARLQLQHLLAGNLVMI